MTIDWTTTAPIDLAALPVAISVFLSAHQAHDLDTELSCFGSDPAVTDDGTTHRGLDAIRAWLERSAGEYTYTTEVVRASRGDDTHFDVVHHLEGDFPGGAVDLHFRFVLDADGRIATLLIEA